MTTPISRDGPDRATDADPTADDPSADEAATDDASRAGGAPPPVHRDRRRRQMGWRSTDVLRTAALVTAMYIGLRLLWVANPLVLTAFLGVLFGLAVAAGVDHVQRVRIGGRALPRGAAAGLIVASFIALLVLFGAWMAPTLRGQATELRQRLPEAVERLQTWVDARRNGVFGLVLGTSEQKPATQRAAGPGAAPAQASAGDSSVKGGAATAGGQPTLRDRIGQQMGSATKYLFPFLHSTISAVAGMFLVIFLSIYIAADPSLYHDGLMHLFPHGARRRAGEVLSAVATVLRRWMFTQLIAMIVIGAVTTIALLLLHVKAAFALGILAGLFEFIPTVGPVLSAVPAVAMAFLDSPEKALYVAIAYVGIQFAENHLLIPLLMKGSMDLPPAVTILSQATMAIVFGFLGLLVAVPLVAAVMVVVKMLYVEGVVGDGMAVGDARAEAAARDAPDDGRRRLAARRE